MLDKIKAFFSGIYGYLAAGAALVFGILVFFLSRKNNEVNALKAQVDLAGTQKEADALEAQIKQKMDQNEMLKKEYDEHQKVLDQLDQKRTQIAQDQANKTPEQIEDYWNKK